MNGNYSCFEFDKLIVNNYLLYECLWNMEKNSKIHLTETGTMNRAMPLNPKSADDSEGKKTQNQRQTCIESHEKGN